MSNEYYDHTTFPAAGSARTSAGMRSELDAVEAGFDKLPTLTGNGLKPIFVNSGASALEAVAFGAAVTNIITGLTADASPDPTADYLATYDASAATGKKVLLKNIFAAATAVGIGTSSPSFCLHIAKASGDADARIVNAGSTGSDTANFQASAGSTSVQSIAYGSGEGYFIATAPTSVTYGNAGNGPVLFIQNNVTRGSIDANGYLLWGYASSNGSYPLQVNGQIFATSSTVATSDGRYKDNVAEISGGLAIVEALRPVTFTWKAHPIHNFDTGTTQIGFIAGEVSTALGLTSFKEGIVQSGRVRIPPGGKDRGGRVLAQGVDETFLGLAEGKLIPILACAIKELKAIVDAQADRIAALERGK